MDYRYNIPTFVDKDKTIVNVLVEIPKGTINKYEIDPNTGSYVTVVRTLHKGTSKGITWLPGKLKTYRYKFNYGFICNTLAGDGDQLDAIILEDERLEPCTIVECRVVGIISTIDNGEQDDKVLVVPIYSNKKSFNVKKILKFLKTYKYPYQKNTTIGDVYNKVAAYREIKRLSLLEYREGWQQSSRPPRNEG